MLAPLHCRVQSNRMELDRFLQKGKTPAMWYTEAPTCNNAVSIKKSTFGLPCQHLNFLYIETRNSVCSNHVYHTTVTPQRFKRSQTQLKEYIWYRRLNHSKPTQYFPSQGTIQCQHSFAIATVSYMHYFMDPYFQGCIKKKEWMHLTTGRELQNQDFLCWKSFSSEFYKLVSPDPKKGLRKLL